MKNFFSFQGRFNIFFVVGALFVVSSFFYTEYPINLIGLMILFIPETKTAIELYKQNGKISVFLVLETILLLTTIYIIISTLLGI